MSVSSSGHSFVVKAWNEGHHHLSGAGYGFKISVKDRDIFFDRSWGCINLVFPTGAKAIVNIDKGSFWNSTCRELISAEIGRWLIAERLAPWPIGKPPPVRLTSLVAGVFNVDVVHTV